MRFSLVVPTLDRFNEVEDLLSSLRMQTFTDFEVLLVDQNKDDRLGPLIDSYTQYLNVTRIRSQASNSSQARNHGLRACSGQIIGFPDDDCVYPSDVLAHVDAAFCADPSLALLSGPAITPDGSLSSGRWYPRSGAISMDNVWTTVIAFNLFISSEALESAGNFDEMLGVNALYGSCEETDLAIRVLSGAKGYYDYALRVTHPDKALTPTSVNRAFAYGTGLGYVLFKHNVSVKTVANFVIRPAGGMLLSLLNRNLLSTRYYWQTLRGRVVGYLSGMIKARAGGR